MKIDANTKISALIKANPKAIDAIAEINKHFRKLKNKILRRTLARRVSIKDAAKIGGVSVETFFEKLTKIGFEIESDMKIGLNEEVNRENNFSTEGLTIINLDVRPNIKAGNDPFSIIMGAIKDLKDGDVLKIINSFEPIPLINVLKGKGYQSKVERPEAGVVLTYFLKSNSLGESLKMEISESGDFTTVLNNFGDKLVKIDVRALEMPEPMVKILSELEVLPEGHGLFVHHKKLPKFLLPELQSRGVIYVKNRIDDHNIDFIFYRK